jgi:hypothetical protein
VATQGRGGRPSYIRFSDFESVGRECRGSSDRLRGLLDVAGMLVVTRKANCSTLKPSSYSL